MNIITLIYNEVLYQPLFNGLIFLYNIVPFHDFGVAIILLTIIIRLILYPLSQKSIKSQKAMQELQPKIKEIQQKYKNEKEKQAQAMMELYKIHKVNPASGCLPILIQLPILIAIFNVFKSGLEPGSLNALYGFISRPEAINPMFLGFLDLSRASIPLAILTGLTQYIQTKMMVSKPVENSSSSDFAGMMNKQMLYFFPLLTVFITASLPAGLGLYWITTTILGIAQQYFVLKQKNG